MAYPPAAVADPADTPETPAPAPTKRTPAQTEAFLQLARDRFRQWQEADATQIEQESEAIRFYNLDQWPAATRAARQAQPAGNGLPALPARPCLTIDQTHEPVQQVLDQERGADLGIELVPAEDFGDLGQTPDASEIELREGLVRRIQRGLEAADARTWAFFHATVAGRGYYGILTQYLPGKTWDQDIHLHRFFNQASVGLDPAHVEPDGSDAEWAFDGVDMPWDRYASEFPDAAEDITDDGAFRAAGDEAPGWFVQQGKRRICRVTNYWYTTRTTRTLALLPDGSVLWQDELSDGVTPRDTREVVERTVHWAKIDGRQVLEETDWPGPDIPIVKVLYEELLPVDGERKVHGVVRPMQDSCEGVNVMASKLVETIGLTPIPPLMLDPEAIADYLPWYEAASTRTLPFLPARTRDDEGHEFREPKRPQVDPPIQAIAGALQMFKEGVQTTSRIHDPSLGKVDPSIKSGRALKAYQEQSLRATSGALVNLKRSMRYEAQIINNLLYPIYGRPGRIVRILDGEGHSQTMTISAPPPPQAPGAPPPPAAGAKSYTLTKDATFNIVARITPSFDSRAAEESAFIEQLFQADPVYLTWFADLYFKSKHMPGHAEMAERAKVMLDPRIQQLIASKEDGQDIPAPVRAALQQKDQQLQEATQLLHKAQQEISGEQLKYASAERIAQMKIDSDERQAAAANETKIAVAELGAKVDRLALFLEERGRIGLQAQAHADRAHDVGMAALEQQHALEQAQQGHQHLLEQGQQGAAVDAAAAEQAQGHALEGAQQAADLAPAPAAETGDG